eukprot:91784-Pleurochrysis_carterae.AAC.1
MRRCGAAKCRRVIAGRFYSPKPPQLDASTDVRAAHRSGETHTNIQTLRLLPSSRRVLPFTKRARGQQGQLPKEGSRLTVQNTAQQDAVERLGFGCISRNRASAVNECYGPT